MTEYKSSNITPDVVNKDAKKAPLGGPFAIRRLEAAQCFPPDGTASV